MTSEELFKAAYDAHHKREDLSRALALYQSVLNEHPNSREAGYARTQIANLERDRERIERRQQNYSDGKRSEHLPSPVIGTSAGRLGGAGGLEADSMNGMAVAVGLIGGLLFFGGIVGVFAEDEAAIRQVVWALIGLAGAVFIAAGAIVSTIENLRRQIVRLDAMKAAKESSGQQSS